MAFSEVGCSEIIINRDKFKMCNPSHYLCLLSVTEKYDFPEKEQLLHMYVMEKTYSISGFNKYLVQNIFITYIF